MITVLWLVLALAVGALAYWRARQHFRAGEVVQAALVVGIASTSVGPIAWPHYQLWVVLAVVWLFFLGERRWTWTAFALYLLLSPAFAGLVGLGMTGGNPLAPLAWELQVLAPIAIAVFGLPHRRAAELADASSAPRLLSVSRAAL